MMKQLDPRSKLVAVFLFMALVIGTPAEAGLRFLVYFLMAAGLTAAARIPLGHAALRILWMVPLLGFLMLSLYAFSPLPPAEKAALALELGAKTGLCLLSLLALTRTTGFTALIQSLNKWKVPAVVTSVLTFTHRYMHLFLQEIETSRRAWTSRSFGRFHKWDSIKLASRLVPHIFLTSMGQSESIYAAMLSRGFDGRLPARNPLHLEFKDYAFMLGFGLAAVLVQVAVP
ncbi:MAG: energy-coupling factor transporter transmembrane component T [Candidatus Aminicenantes bacterium]